jgi:hypothetical protein
MSSPLFGVWTDVFCGKQALLVESLSMKTHDSEGMNLLHEVRRWLGVGLIGLGVLGSIVVGLAWIRSQPAQIAQADVIPFTDVDPYGANFFLHRELEPWKQEQTLEMAQAAGIVWIKQQFPWDNIELLQGEYVWDRSDHIVDLAEQYDMQIIARLDRTPEWARPTGNFASCPPDDANHFGDFVYAFVRRYSGRVRYVQIWNEPNLAAEWCFFPVNAEAYTYLLEVAYRRAKEADPNVIVLSAPLAINREDISMRGNVSDLVFLEQMYQAGAGGHFDVLAANGFGLGSPPEEPPGSEVLNLRRIELQREIMERYGDADKPIWLNEYGWNSPPEDFPPELLIWARTTEAEQAEYTTRGIAWAREHWPWLGVVNVWYFRQPGQVPPERADYYFAMVYPDFTPRPVYHALREASQGVGVAGAGLHQETSPAVSAPGWRMLLDPTASAEAMLVAGEGEGGLTFTFSGEQVCLVSTRGPERGWLQVEVDGEPPTGLALDDAGRALVDLASDQVASRDVICLADDLGEGVHHLSLTPSGAGTVTVDGFVVAESGQLPVFVALWMVCGAAVVVGTILQATSSARRSARSRG